MTLEEYKDFTAGTPEIAAKIYTYFDTDKSNCLTVDKVASQFDIMDSDGRFDAQWLSKTQPSSTRQHYVWDAYVVAKEKIGEIHVRLEFE